MTRHLFVLALIVGIASCSRTGEAPASAGVSPPAEQKAGKDNQFLAYEHSLDIEAEEEKVVPAFEAAQAACRAAIEDSCAILEARVSSGDRAFASLKFRARAEGIRKLVEVLSAQGEVSNQSTSAEDLAGPIADAEKQLAMLTDYRKQLEAIRGRPNNDLESLIKLTRELAGVQSEIESLSGSRAHLMQRVQTELLSVSIRSHFSESVWAPVSGSASEFGGVVLMGVANLIMVLAYLLPWVTVLAFAYWAFRAFRNWRKRKLLG